MSYSSHYQETSQPQTFKSLKLRVLVYEINHDEPIRDHICDFSDPDKRRWISNLIVWAATNQKVVEILNIRDDHG